MGDGVSLMKGGGGSVLAAMQQQVAARTGSGAPKPSLSALPTEKNGPTILRPAAPLDGITTPAAFPNDKPVEEVQRILAGLIVQRDHLNAVIEGLRLLAGDPEAAAADATRRAEDTKALLEREADRRIADAAAAAASPDPKDKKAVATQAAAQARVEAAPGMEDVVKAAEAKDRKRAEVLSLLVEAGTTEDEDFTERLARLQAEAQAAVFTEPSGATVALAEDMGVDITGEWYCPVHGKAVVKISARRQREYRACPECNEFERL